MRTLKTSLAVAFVAGAVLAAHGATLCEGESAAGNVDLTPGVRTSSGHETLAYSLLWHGVEEGASVTILQDGEVFAEGLTGEGVLPWNVAHGGTYVLTYKVMSGDEQVGEALTATFFVEPEDPEIFPASGTTFGTSLTVTMSCPTKGAKIHYTLDGSDPTAESAAYNRKFRVYGKTTVKAVAEKNGVLSDVVTAEYALGRCGDPAIYPADGTEFAHSNQVASIAWGQRRFFALYA